MCVSQCVYTHIYKYVCACVCICVCVFISLQKYLKNAEIWQKMLKCHIIYHSRLTILMYI